MMLFDASGQENLRARVATTTFEAINDDNESTYDFGTHFSYDAAQNRVIKAQTNTSTQTTTYTYYIRDAEGNTMAVYERDQSDVTWKEQYLFGSSRLGSLRPDVTWNTSNPYSTDGYFTTQGELQEGWKQYELSNHLGNVLATINDRKTGVDTTSDNSADYYEANILSANDYYPFGMDMPGRQYSLNGYRFGFNGKEKDTEGEWGDLTHYDYGFRIYNPGIGKFLSVDPLTKSYPELTPFQYASNSPIANIDLDGLESYYSADGDYLMKYGNSPEIRVVNPTFFASVQRSEYSNEFKARLLSEWSAVAYEPSEEARLVLDFSLKYLPQTLKDGTERGQAFYSKTLQDENGTLRDVIVPGGVVMGERKEGREVVAINNSKAFIGGLDLKEFFGWKMVSAVHTHPKGYDKFSFV